LCKGNLEATGNLSVVAGTECVESAGLSPRLSLVVSELLFASTSGLVSSLVSGFGRMSGSGRVSGPSRVSVPGPVRVADLVSGSGCIPISDRVRRMS
jgi:hypothetical protein